MSQHYLHFRIVEALGLVAKDAYGYSDPYCIVSLKNNGKQIPNISQYKTSIIKRTVNPLWDETFSIPVLLKHITPQTRIYFDLWDKDNDLDDSLGSASLNMNYFNNKNVFRGWLKGNVYYILIYIIIIIIIIIVIYINIIFSNQ